MHIKLNDLFLEMQEQLDRNQAVLDEYFGQTESEDCGTCDVCRAKPKAARSEDPSALISSFINGEMSGIYAIDDVLCRFASPGQLAPEDCVTVLRRLIDEGKVPAPLQ